MAINIVDRTALDNALTATADAIRAKTGDTDELDFDMAGETGFESAIENSGLVKPTGSKSITANGTHDVSDFASAVVNVPAPAPVLQDKTITPTKQQQAVSPDAGYYGLSGVTVNAIPANYNDTSAVTAVAGDVLANKTIVNAAGQNVAGTMPNNGAVSKTLDATEDNQSYTVPAGYHNGSGAVAIVLEEKPATPTESTQVITPTTGKVLSKVTIGPIPDNYGDTTGTDAAAADLLAGKTAIVDDNGHAAEITGTMVDRGTVTKTLDATTGNQSFTIAAGKHSGSGAVNIVLETKQATPTKSTQTVTPTAGKVLSTVTVNPIPAIYGDATNADAAAANILAGKKAVVNVSNAATLVTGSMANNGAISGSIDGMTTTSYTVPAGYTSGGSVSLTNDIETALAAI